MSRHRLFPVHRGSFLAPRSALLLGANPSSAVALPKPALCLMPVVSSMMLRRPSASSGLAKVLDLCRTVPPDMKFVALRSADADRPRSASLPVVSVPGLPPNTLRPLPSPVSQSLQAPIPSGAGSQKSLSRKIEAQAALPRSCRLPYEACRAPSVGAWLTASPASREIHVPSPFSRVALQRTPYWDHGWACGMCGEGRWSLGFPPNPVLQRISCTP